MASTRMNNQAEGRADPETCDTLYAVAIPVANGIVWTRRTDSLDACAALYLAEAERQGGHVGPGEIFETLGGVVGRILPDGTIVRAP